MMVRRWVKNAGGYPPNAISPCSDFGTIMSSIRRTIIVLIITYVLVPVCINANDVRVVDLAVNHTRYDVTVSLKVEDAFSEALDEAILTGIPIAFVYRVVLYQPRFFWIDKKIGEIEIHHGLRYDNLKREFVVRRSWQTHEPLATPSLHEAKRLMAEIHDLKIIPLSRLDSGKYYRIAVKAKLGKTELPFKLPFPMVFSSPWSFETDWYSIVFFLRDQQ
jgi:hypothetical protein